MTREEATQAMIQCQSFNDEDPERGHDEADLVLAALLRHLGYGDVVDEWDKVVKWYT